MTKLIYNALSGEFDYAGEPSTGIFTGEINHIPQKNIDPIASPDQVWVLKSIGAFKFSYKTSEGTTKRVTLNLS